VASIWLLAVDFRLDASPGLDEGGEPSSRLDVVKSVVAQFIKNRPTIASHWWLFRPSHT